MLKFTQVQNLESLNQNQKAFLNFLIKRKLFFEKDPPVLNEEIDFLYNVQNGWPLDTNLFYPNRVINKENKLDLFSGFVFFENELHPISFFNLENKAYDPIADLFQIKSELYLGLKVHITHAYNFMSRQNRCDKFNSPGELQFTYINI